MSKNLKQQIIKDLEKTGFPLEVFVASEIENNDWMVYNSTLYRDEQTEQPRELDIHAVKVDFRYARYAPRKVKRGDENKLISHLIIQCKKTDKPWIFFDNGRTSWPCIPPGCLKSEREEFHGMLFEQLELFGLKNYRLKKAILHKSYHEAFSDPKYSSKIFESFITVIKALKYFKKRYGSSGYAIHNFMPVVILDGTLWSATLKKKITATSAIILKEVDRLFVVFNQLSKPDERNTSFEEEQIIEIITRRGFKKYLKEIEKNNIELYKCWTTFISKNKQVQSRQSRRRQKFNQKKNKI